MCKIVLESRIWLFPTDILSLSLKLGWQTPVNLLCLPITALRSQAFPSPCLAFIVGSRHLESDCHAYVASCFHPVGHLSSPTGLIYGQSLLVTQTHSLFSQSTEVEGSLCCLNVYSVLEYVSYKCAADMDSFIMHAVGSHLLTVNMVRYTPK